MLAPHLHFGGNCMEAIGVYAKAFNAKVEPASIDYMSDGKRIAHSVMKIHGTDVYLNDALEFLRDAYGYVGSGHLTVTFDTVDDLLSCYEMLKANDGGLPFYETPYSKLAGNFVDKFGVLWGFMVVA